MTSPLDRVMQALGGGRPAGAGFLAKCPGHDDRRESLSVTSGEDGRALLYCHAGCSLDEILAPLGLRRADLFPSRGGNGTGGCRGVGRIVRTYDYRTENGDLLYEVVRYDPKGFKQRRPDGAGGWIWSLEGVQRVPYRLPELFAEPERFVFIVEGEKDVESLERVGLLATTCPQGAGKWGKLDPK